MHKEYHMKKVLSALSVFAAGLAFGLDAGAAVTGGDIAKYDLANGESVYTASCAACHTSGILKSPKTGVQADWTARLEQGMDTLIKKSIDGYTDVGNMPAKGGNDALTDAEVANAVAYMVKQLQ